MRKASLAFLLAGLLLGGPAAAQCKLEKIGEWSVQLPGNQPIIDGAINGTKVGILLDTGASSSMVTREAATRLKLPMAPLNNVRVYGVGGVQTPDAADIAEFRLGEAVKKDWTVLVADARAGRVGFILGDDFFRQLDLELDLPHGVMRFFRSTGCERANLGYWSPQANVMVPLEGDRGIRFVTELNGVQLQTMLDTGASNTVVSLGMARAAGFNQEAPDVVGAGCASGVGARSIETWYGAFDRFVIGDQAIRNATLTVSDLWRHSRTMGGTGSNVRRGPEGSPEMLLGMDFLRTHRIFISRAHKRMWFTHEGGLVFPTSPRAACQGDTAGRIAKARALSRSGDRDAALAEFDAVVAGDATSTAARVARAELFMQRKEPERAILDYDAAMAAGVNNPQLYAMRGIAHRQKGDKARALEDFETALRLNPREAQALYWRGVHRLESGDRAGAQADLDMLEKHNPKSAAELRKRIEAGGS